MKIFDKEPLPPKDEDIFIDDVDVLVKKSYPDHEGQHPLFKKFGTRTGGFFDTWIYTKDWNQLSETEKWKYVALCALYWKEHYEYWLDKKEYDRFKKLIEENDKENNE